MAATGRTRHRAVRFAVLAGALSALAIWAFAQQAGGPGGIDREVHRQTSQEYLEWQRFYWEEARRAQHEVDRQIALEKARCAEQEARKHAEQAGPVAEHEYWREQARIHREHARNCPAGSDERKAHQEYADSCDKQASAKLDEAHRKAETDPAVREDLSNHYRREAEARREEARRYREKGWNDLADRADKQAEGCEEAADRYGTPPSGGAKGGKGKGGKKSPSLENSKKDTEEKLKKQAETLEKDIRNTPNLSHEARRRILTELQGLRAGEGKPGDQVDAQRRDLVDRYGKIGDAVDAWKKTLEKKKSETVKKSGDKKGVAKAANKRTAAECLDWAQYYYMMARRADTPEEREEALAKAREYERQGLEAAREAGPVAEAEYWHQRAAIMRSEAAHTGGHGKGEAWEAVAGDCDKNAGKAMDEAHRKAETDPAVREDLRDHYRSEAERHRAEARRYHERADNGEISRAAAEALATDAERKAAGCDEAAERYSKPPE